MIFSSTFRYPADAWQWALGTIQTYGDLVRTEDGALTKEVMNLAVTVEKPLEGWPVQGSGWNLAGLARYAEQLMSGENAGFDYDYGSRIRRGLAPIDHDRIAREGMMVRLFGQEHARDHYGIDQLKVAIEVLRKNPTTRRAPIYIWEPSFDLGSPKHVPCMQLIDPLIRGGKLHFTTFFRSHDVGRAWCPNVYGLARLMEHIANEVGVPCGSLTTMSCSAHVYEE